MKHTSNESHPVIENLEQMLSEEDKTVSVIS